MTKAGQRFQIEKRAKVNYSIEAVVDFFTPFARTVTFLKNILEIFVRKTSSQSGVTSMSNLCQLFSKVLLYPELSENIDHIVASLARVASISVWFRNKERGTRVKDRAKNGASKRARRGGEERKETLADKSRDFENHPLGLACLSSRTDI